MCGMWYYRYGACIEQSHFIEQEELLWYGIYWTGPMPTEDVKSVDIPSS